MKAMNITNKVLEELDAGNGPINVTRNVFGQVEVINVPRMVLGKYVKFINSSLSYILSLSPFEIRDIIYAVANDEHQSLLQLLTERYLESAKISDPMVELISGSVLIQTVLHFLKAIFRVIVRVCNPMDVFSVKLTLRGSDDIDIKCVYVV